MSSNDMEPGLRAFLEAKLDTFEKVDVMLALWNWPGHVLTVPTLTETLPYERDTIRETVMALRVANLVEQTVNGRVRLIATEHDRALLAQLAHRDRVEVATVLSALAVERIRALAAKTFRP